MGSDESHFNVSVGSDGQSHNTVSTNHNLFEEKGEPKRNRTEVLPAASQPNALPLGQTGSLQTERAVRYFLYKHVHEAVFTPLPVFDNGHVSSQRAAWVCFAVAKASCKTKRERRGKFHSVLQQSVHEDRINAYHI